MASPVHASCDEELTHEEDPSQACFVLHSDGSKDASVNAAALKRSPSKSAKSRKQQRCGKPIMLPLPPCLNDEPPECGFWRGEAFHTMWEKIENSIKNVFELHNTNIFKEVQKFIRDTLFCDAQLKLYLSAKAPHPSIAGSNAKQLHAALIYLRNVDSSDHTTTFLELRNYLKKNDCHVANLLPHNFSSNAGVGGPLHNLIKQIVKINPDTTDMDILVSWHRDVAHVNHPIVIIIEDAELCNSMVLADFIVVLSEWITQLPIVLVLGMATSGDAVGKLLPASAVRHLHIHCFSLPSPEQYLEGIIEAVLATPCISFDIGCDVLKFFLNHFKKYDCTVTSFLRALKMACMEHFYCQPLSFLCTKLFEPPDQTDLEDFCKSLPDTLLQYASTLPSVQSIHFEHLHGIAKEMALALCKLRQQKQNWSAVLQCLLVTGKLLGLDFTEILSNIFEQSAAIVKLGDFRAQENVVFDGNSCEKEQYVHAAVISSVLKKMREASESTLQRLLNQWEKLTENLTEWRGKIQNLSCEVASETYLENRMGHFSNTCNGSLRTKMLLSSVHDSLEEQQIKLFSNADVAEDTMVRTHINSGDQAMDVGSNHSNLSRKMTGNQAMLKKVCSRMHSKTAASLLELMMRKHLIPLASLPFSEILSFGNVAAIRQALIGEPRKTIQRDLQNAQMALQFECCGSSDLVSPFMDDSSILFRMAKNHHDHVSVYDLYKSFETVLRQPDIDDKMSRKGNQKKRKAVQCDLDRASIQARFCKAASELQLVGLFRMPSKKRSDFVQLGV